MPSARLLVIAFLAPIVVALVGPSPTQRTCTYRTFTWNAIAQRAEDHRTVRISYAELGAAKRDSTTGCSLCEEDQVEVQVPGVTKFHACRLVADRVRGALERAIANGERITTVVGYRVGLTRGEADAAGRRTGFSNHSFGVAFDVNEAQNGLYADCVTFGASCRLLRGGAWRPGEGGAITSEGPLVREFAAAGFKWGGAIAGRQKDFMHFSPTGY